MVELVSEPEPPTLAVPKNEAVAWAEAPEDSAEEYAWPAWYVCRVAIPP